MLRVSILAVAAGMAAAIVCVCTPARAQTPAPTAPATTSPAKQKAAPTGPAGKGLDPATNIGPDMTSETYGDWIMRCQQVAGVKYCEVSQTIVIQGQQNPIALVAFGRDKKDSPVRIVVQLPTNITFEGGVKTLLADSSPAADLVFRRCFPVGCFADAILDEATIAKLKAQTEPGSVKFKDATEREISLPLSLKGFGSAIEALSRR